MRQNGELRLSLDGSQLLKPSKNIIQINDAQAQQWLKGQDIFIKTIIPE